jgi:hypothetical protein
MPVPSAKTLVPFSEDVTATFRFGPEISALIQTARHQFESKMVR